jgi:glycosyltransferase involved in cell wall biosynthesis
MIRDDRPMEPRARVLAVAQSASLGGAELALLRIAERLPAHGIEVELTVPGDGPAADAASHRLPVGRIQAGAWPRAVAAWPRARRLARGFDAVLLNGIVTQRLAPAIWGTTTIVPYIHELTDTGPRAWRSARYWRAAPIVLCACEAVAQRCRAFGAPGDRLRTVYAPVETVAPAPRPAWAGGPVVGYVGRIQPGKGTLDLVHAMREVDATLVIAGEGSGAYAEEVRREAEEVRREAGEGVVMLGHVDDARALMHWFDVLAVPSHREAFGTVAAEALAAGTPVVATRSGGIEEYVVPGRNGDLVPPGDPDALAQAIRGLLPKAASMADAAREDAARFDAGRVAASVADAIHEAIARRGG